MALEACMKSKLMTLEAHSESNPMVRWVWRHFRMLGPMSLWWLAAMLQACAVSADQIPEIPVEPIKAVQNVLIVLAGITPVLSAFMRMIFFAITQDARKCSEVFGSPGTCAEIFSSLIWLVPNVVGAEENIEKGAAVCFLMHIMVNYIYLLCINRGFQAIMMSMLTIPSFVLYVTYLQFEVSLPKSVEIPASCIGLLALVFVQIFQIRELKTANGCLDRSLMFLDVMFELVANASMFFTTLAWHRDLQMTMIAAGINSFLCLVKIGLSVSPTTGGVEGVAHNGGGQGPNQDNGNNTNQVHGGDLEAGGPVVDLP